MFFYLLGIIIPVSKPEGILVWPDVKVDRINEEKGE